MAEFNYIKGRDVTGNWHINALSYELYNETTGKTIDSKNKFTALREYGMMTEDGEFECSNAGMTLTNITVYPLRKLTETGYRYYVRVKGKFRVSQTSQIDYDGICYLDGYYLNSTNGNRDTITFYCNNQLEQEDDGYYIVAKWTHDGEEHPARFRVYKTDYKWSAGTGYISNVSVLGASNDDRKLYYHSEYIPLFALTDDIEMPDGNVCFGPIDMTADGHDQYIMLFYDNNMEFIKGVKRSDIQAAYTAGKIESVEYLNRGEIIDFIRAYESHNPEFVVFAEHKQTASSAGPKVSTGEIYFPLFALPDSDFVEGVNVLRVRAIADGLFFRDSEYSTFEHIEYTRIYSTSTNS